MAEAAVARQSFASHLQEFRVRLMWVALTVLAGAGVGLWQGSFLREILIRPIGQTLYYTSPSGGFNLTIQLALFFGALVAVPVASYQLLKFLEPAIPSVVSSAAFSYVASACVLLCAGVSFAYFVALPGALYFLTDFSTDQIRALVTVDEYVRFVGVYVLSFALFFQLPLISLVVHKATRFPASSLRKLRPHMFAAAFIAAALITPTGDPVNMSIMALPIVILYEVSIIVVKCASRTKRPRARREVPVPPLPPPDEIPVQSSPRRSMDGIRRR